MFVLRWTTISIHISTSDSVSWHATHSNEPNDGRHFEGASAFSSTSSRPVVAALYGIRFRCRAREITATAVSKSFRLTTHCTRNWQRSIIPTSCLIFVGTGTFPTLSGQCTCCCWLLITIPLNASDCKMELSQKKDKQGLLKWSSD